MASPRSRSRSEKERNCTISANPPKSAKPSVKWISSRKVFAECKAPPSPASHHLSNSSYRLLHILSIITLMRSAFHSPFCLLASLAAFSSGTHLYGAGEDALGLPDLEKRGRNLLGRRSGFAAAEKSPEAPSDSSSAATLGSWPG